MKRPTSVLFLLLFGYGASALADNCAAAGEPVQWIADYCMFVNETDDLEAAMPCIGTFSKLEFPDACMAKLHFKRLLCEAQHAMTNVHQSVEQCVGDRAFSGNTVRNNGSGG